MEQHTIIWRGLRIAITFTPNKFGMADHIELQTEKGIPLPVTDTGYRSHFAPSGTVDAHGGAVAFATAWLAFEAHRTGWSGAQLSPF